MQIDDNWISLLPNMVATCRRNGRFEDFEKFIIHHPYNASEYASSVIKGRWPEAEETIATDANASINYAKYVIGGRWEMGEDAISTDPNASFNYAKTILRGRFEKGEEAISKSVNVSMNYARDVLKTRFILGEPIIASFEATNGDHTLTKDYCRRYVRDPSDWSSWTIDQLKHSPCWMYMYAKEYLKGRLPDFLHNTMIMFSMNIPNNYYVKRYFKAKKYNKKIKRRKKPETLNQNLGA